MKHTKRRKRHTLRRRNTRRKRTLRGGSEPEANTNANAKKKECVLPPGSKINWPADDGCEPGIKKELIKVTAHTKFDRFGPYSGFFVAKMGENGKGVSYKKRSLPYIRPTNSKGKSCKNAYNDVYPEYHVYEAIVDIPDVEQCTAAPFAGHRGQAIQWKFKNSIKQLLKEKIIKELPERPAFEDQSDSSQSIVSTQPVFEEQSISTKPVFKPTNKIVQPFQMNSDSQMVI